MFYGFLAMKEHRNFKDQKRYSGERLSHAVSCAFVICFRVKAEARQRMQPHGTSYFLSGQDQFYQDWLVQTDHFH
jgi:hypothetical protein